MSGPVLLTPDRSSTTHSSIALATERLSVERDGRWAVRRGARIVTALVSCWKPTLRRADVVGDDQIEVLAAQLALPRWRPDRRSRRRSRPASGRAACVRRAPARMSGVGSRTISGTPSSFLILPGSATFGRKSATAAAMTTTSAVDASASTAACISAAVSTGTQLGAGRRGQADRRDQRHLGTQRQRLGGDGVALLAAAAVGDDPHGVDRLAGATGGDDDVQPGECAATEHPLDLGDDPLRRWPGGPCPSRHRPGGPRRARRRARRGGAAWRCCRRRPGAPTSRCASPGRRSPGHGWPAGRWSADRSTARRRRRRSAGRWPARRGRGRRTGRAGCAGSACPRPTGWSAPARWPAPTAWCVPRKCSAPFVITGMTWAPASTSRRQTSTAL